MLSGGEKFREVDCLEGSVWKALSPQPAIPVAGQRCRRPLNFTKTQQPRSRPSRTLLIPGVQAGPGYPRVKATGGGGEHPSREDAGCGGVRWGVGYATVGCQSTLQQGEGGREGKGMIEDVRVGVCVR